MLLILGTDVDGGKAVVTAEPLRPLTIGDWAFPNSACGVDSGGCPRYWLATVSARRYFRGSERMVADLSVA